MAANGYPRPVGSYPNGEAQGYDFHNNNVGAAHDQLRDGLYYQAQIGEQSSPVQQEVYARTFSNASTPPQQSQLASPQPCQQHPHSGYWESGLLSPPDHAPTAHFNHRHSIPGALEHYGTRANFGRIQVQGYDGMIGSTGTSTAAVYPLSRTASQASSQPNGQRSGPQLQQPLPDFSPSTASYPDSLRSPFSTSDSPETPPYTSKRSKTTDDIIGHVYVNEKKFRCSRKECHMNFGRLADLRRHFKATHVQNRSDYYCSQDGCQRSYNYNGNPGRGFGTRKDKCEEHIRTVHREIPEHLRGHAQLYSLAN